MAELHPFAPNVPPLHAEAQKRSRLAALGLTEELLLDAIRFAYEERERCTGNDVNAAGGYAAWGKPIRFLRDAMIPKGWSRDGAPRLESVVSPDRSFRITSSAGNYSTGDLEHEPATYGLKGRLALEAIEDNGQTALNLAGGAPLINPMITFYLLSHLDTVKERITSELSIPTHMSIKPTAKKGRIDAFRNRVALEPIDLNTDDPESEEEIEEDFSEDLDIEIPRRRLSE
jgi:hypothetical protein